MPRTTSANDDTGAFVRREYRRRNASVPIGAAEDPRLSLQAVGLYMYIMVKPDNWIARMSDMIRAHTNGTYAVRSALAELIEYHYVSREFTKNADGTFRWDIVFWEEPEDNPNHPNYQPSRGNCTMVNNEPSRGFPPMENCTITSIYTDLDHRSNTKEKGANAPARKPASARRRRQPPTDEQQEAQLMTKLRQTIKRRAEAQAIDPATINDNGYMDPPTAMASRDPIAIYYSYFSIARTEHFLDEPQVKIIRATVTPDMAERWANVCRRYVLHGNYRRKNFKMMFDWLNETDATASYASRKPQAEKWYGSTTQGQMTDEQLQELRRSIAEFERNGIPVDAEWYTLANAGMPNM